MWRYLACRCRWSVHSCWRQTNRAGRVEAVRSLDEFACLLPALSLILGLLLKPWLRKVWDGPKCRRASPIDGQIRLDIGWEFCECQISEGSFPTAFTREYDVFSVEG